MRALPTAILFTLASSALAAAPPQWFLDDIKVHTAHGGRWVADNSAYKSENEPFDAYVIEWKSGFDGTTMTGRLFGLDDGEETPAFWEFRQYWHPGRKEAVIEQFGWDGAFGIGTVTRDAVAEQTIYNADGSTMRIGHRSEGVDADTRVQESFTIVDGEWRPRRKYTWIRQRIEPTRGRASSSSGEIRIPVATTAMLVPILWLAAASQPSPAAPLETGPVTVEIRQQGERYVLLRGGRPYEIKGAGIGFDGIASLAAHGGNSFRTWSTGNGERTGRQILDEAARHGLTVAFCIDIGRERHGFDYNDEKAVAAQLEYARGEVQKYKDHPALLAWIIGNEPNLDFDNPKVFDAIDDISRMIHEVDGNHPTTTALAGFSGELAGLIEERAPDLDFVSIQMYGDIVDLPRYLDEAGFDEPYFITEWGAVGYWEAPQTAWGAPIEQTSSEKARTYLTAHNTAIAPDTGQVLGSYVFLWGQKQERTPTWFGMFLADGTETEAVDVLHYLWNGSWPKNRSPRIDGMVLDAKASHENVVVDAGERYEASVIAVDPDGDALDFRWEIMQESTATQTGGDREEIPETLPGLVEGDKERVLVTAPGKPGAYRLFVYAYDGNGNAGHANVPFRVRE